MYICVCISVSIQGYINIDTHTYKITSEPIILDCLDYSGFHIPFLRSLLHGTESGNYIFQNSFFYVASA